MLMDIAKLFTDREGTMFSSSDKFIIHRSDELCSEHASAGKESDVGEIEELLEGFKWRERGLRLYRCLMKQIEDPPEAYLMVDLLRFCSTPQSKFSSNGEANDKKMINILKKYKAQGLRLPQAYLTRPSAKKMF